MALDYLLMGAQAAGVFGSLLGDRQQRRFAKMGMNLENANANLRMQQERLAFEEQGLAAVNELREVMATQRALFAAQGRVPGIGSTAAIENRSLHNFTKDENARALSLNFRNQYLNAYQSANRIDYLGTKSKSSSKAFGSFLEMIDFNQTGSMFGTNKTTKGGFESPLGKLNNG